MRRLIITAIALTSAVLGCTHLRAAATDEPGACVEVAPGVWVTAGEVGLPLPCGPSLASQPTYPPIDPVTGCTPAVPSDGCPVDEPAAATQTCRYDCTTEPPTTTAPSTAPPTSPPVTEAPTTTAPVTEPPVATTAPPPGTEVTTTTGPTTTAAITTVATAPPPVPTTPTPTTLPVTGPPTWLAPSLTIAAATMFLGAALLRIARRRGAR